MREIEASILNKKVMEDIKKTYNNFSLRRDSNSWAKILNPHVNEIRGDERTCMDIIRFFSKHNKIPREVWRNIWHELRLETKIVNISNIFSLKCIDEIYKNMYAESMFDYKLIPKEVGNKADKFIENLDMAYSEISYNEFYKARLHLEDAKSICENIDTILLEATLERCKYNVNISLELVDKALDMDPNKVEAYLNKGITYMMMGKINEAYDVLKEVQNRCNSNYNIQSRLIECCLSLGKYEEARELSLSLLYMYPHIDSIKTSCDGANKFIIDKLQKKEALSDYEKSSLAESYLYMGNIDKAYDMSLSSENYLNSSSNGCVIFGNILRELKRYEEAIVYYKKAISYDKSNYKAYYCIGRVYDDMSDSDGARKYYEQAIDINKDFKQAYITLAKIYMNLKKYDYAQKLIDILIYDNFQIANAYSLKGQWFQRQHKDEEALIFYSKSISEGNHSLSAYMDKSMILRRLNRYNEANNICNKALDYGYNDSCLYIEKARIYQEVGQFEDAIYWLEAIGDGEELSSEVLFQKAVCYSKLGNEIEAKECFDRAIEIDDSYKEMVLE